MKGGLTEVREGLREETRKGMVPRALLHSSSGWREWCPQRNYVKGTALQKLPLWKLEGRRGPEAGGVHKEMRHLSLLRL